MLATNGRVITQTGGPKPPLIDSVHKSFFKEVKLPQQKFNRTTIILAFKRISPYNLTVPTLSLIWHPSTCFSLNRFRRGETFRRPNPLPSVVARIHPSLRRPIKPNHAITSNIKQNYISTEALSSLSAATTGGLLLSFFGFSRMKRTTAVKK